MLFKENNVHENIFNSHLNDLQHNNKTPKIGNKIGPQCFEADTKYQRSADYHHIYIIVHHN